ncbi:hypothetical protein [Thermomonas haemolytica]|nr:hypothetical protein [Thermomonas haemolytica]
MANKPLLRVLQMQRALESGIRLVLLQAEQWQLKQHRRSLA